MSFGVLYITLPDYYFYIKNKSLHSNAALLAEEINKLDAIEKIQSAINDFTFKNNASVVIFQEQNASVVGVSMPFSIMYTGSDMVGHDRQQWVKAISREELEAQEINPEADEEDKLYTVAVAGQIPGSHAKTEVIQFESRPFSINRGLSGMSVISFELLLQNDFADRIEIISTLQPIDEAKNVIVSLSPYLLAVNIVFAIIAAYLYSRHMSRPIVALSDAAAKMQSMTPGIISGIRTNNEIGELSENLDLLYLSLCSNIQNLQREMEKVSVLEKSKADFMRAASHELKTPLAALNCINEGMIDNMGRYKDREKYLLESKKLINSISKLTAEILKASKMEAADNELYLESVNITGLIESVLEDYRVFIEEKKLDLALDCPGNAEVFIETDVNIMRNVLSNIISNAVKYTENGGEVIIAINEVGEVSIENQCENVPEDKLNKLFDPFYTLEYSRNRIKSGTGLGLHIVKHNLEALGVGYKLENTQLGLRFSMSIR